MGSRYAEAAQQQRSEGASPPESGGNASNQDDNSRRTITLERCESSHKMTSRRTATARSRPPDIGILAVELYVPNLYVDQAELEIYDGEARGKYTNGLGQEEIAFPSDLEDAASMAMTAVDMLMTKHGVDWDMIGLVQVGTETLIDKSKPIKSYLMQLWEARGSRNPDIEGGDCISACYGGVAAVFHVLNWLESTAWDGRFALAVATDVAIYDRGALRPTSGAAAIALLFGPHAPLIVEPGLRTTHSKHTYDSYRPVPESQYPLTFQELADESYYKSMEDCYLRFCKKCEHRGIFSRQTGRHSLYDFDSIVFQCPNVRMVETAFAVMYYADYTRATASEKAAYYPGIRAERPKDGKDLYAKKFVAELTVSTRRLFEKKSLTSVALLKRIGNVHTASVFAGLISVLITTQPEDLISHRIGIFGYGNGMTASMFAIDISEDPDTLNRLLEGIADINARLEGRKKLTPDKFVEMIERREKSSFAAPFRPLDNPSSLRPGTWYLESVDSMHRRVYKQFGKIQRLTFQNAAPFCQSNVWTLLKHREEGSNAEPQ
ncbi:unnamed protein product [Notodromas monacha]|uniref:Hydroxymethylglutaryl-CoA synthase n=1 Tax=Notodromas monacha TaxID=399045 RepID=A0A7R9GBL7_9CRUS|nr:unnamed protein product [Notodromas monacha]CAG0915188.1 unnamed protein product [Notodromas monacha]